MEKTDNYFVISNYNCDPRHLLEYCRDYVVYDQSSEQKYKDVLSGANFVTSKHTGHNISDYFKFFIDRYGDLPERISLIKGNIFPRHLSREFFDKVYGNKFYTFLFENKKYNGNKTRAYFLFSENEYLEYNNSWFVKEHPHWYFQKYNEILRFIYKSPELPRYNLYSPGACYIVTKHQVLKNSRQFYKNVLKLITYTIPVNPFPSEAHQVEWLCHTIYTSNYEVQDYMNSDIDFDVALTALCTEKKATRKVLDILMTRNQGRVEADGANRSFIKAGVASFKAVKGIPSAKILVIGVHSWGEIEYWGKAFPNASVIGAGILELAERKGAQDSVQYVRAPLSRLSEMPQIKGEEFDLIVYEGYHLKADAIILSSLKESHLKYGGELFVFDVLSIPMGVIGIISKEMAGAAYLASCIPVNYDNMSGKYLVRIKKRQPSLLRSVCYRFFNRAVALLYGLHWARWNCLEHFKRRLPV